MHSKYLYNLIENSSLVFGNIYFSQIEMQNLSPKKNPKMSADNEVDKQITDDLSLAKGGVSISVDPGLNDSNKISDISIS